jgi:hypothetical protein
MMLRSPIIDLVLPLAFTAMAFFAALAFARIGWSDGIGLGMTGFVGGLFWTRAAVLTPIDDPSDQER